MQVDPRMRREKRLDALVLWAARLSTITWMGRRGCAVTMSPRNSMNASLVWRGTVWPMISPVRVFSAAYSESVPWR